MPEMERISRERNSPSPVFFPKPREKIFLLPCRDPNTVVFADDSPIPGLLLL
jgi:hypothetical protein